MNEEILEVLEEKLGEKRLAHTLGVAECAAVLAERFGENAEKAYTAGLLHDIAKEESLEKMQMLCRGLDLDDEMLESRALLHGPAGAQFSKKHFKIGEDIYSACFYHTIGRENMTKLEKIIYVADCIEKNRTQPGVEALRLLAEKDLDDCLLHTMEDTISYLEKNGRKVYKKSIDARNYLLKSLEKCGKIIK